MFSRTGMSAGDGWRSGFGEHGERVWVWCSGASEGGSGAGNGELMCRSQARRWHRARAPLQAEQRDAEVDTPVTSSRPRFGIETDEILGRLESGEAKVGQGSA